MKAMMLNMSNIECKVVILTGASSGIGEATAKVLASKGAKLVLAARREERLVQLQKEIQNNGGHAIVKPTDVTSQTQMEVLAEYAINVFLQALSAASYWKRQVILSPKQA